MSFFDEADEPQPTRQETRRPRRVARPPRAGSGRPPGGSGRPPGGRHQQEVQTRRLVLAGVVVVIVIAMALLIHSCDTSATNTALKNYNADVYNLINASDATGAQALGDQGLTSGKLGTLNLAPQAHAALLQLEKAEGFHPPSQMAGAQAALVSVMRLRHQALTTIANSAQKAANKRTSKDAVYNISLGTSQLYSSDVIYKTFVVTDIAKALNAASIPVGSAAGEQPINTGQVITDLGWLQSTWIADKIGAQLSTAQANINNSQPNLGHGHQLNYVTADGITLNPAGITTVPAKNAQAWTLNLSNSGQTDENQVVCLLRIHGVESGTATIPQTTPGEVTTCTVTLHSPPPAGLYSVTATIEKVPYENDLRNNTHTYTVTFS